MFRYPLLFTCLFVISINLSAAGSQLEKDNDDSFGISELEVLKKESEFINDLIEKSIFQETEKTCSKDSDCLYGGKCTTDGTCSCPEGTNGTLCENVVQCLKYPDMCGNGTDVKCAFNVFDKIAYCKCDDSKKLYDDYAERCAIPCEKYVNHQRVKDSCGKYGLCTNSFCSCVDGVSGDRCEIIDQCARKEVDCGKDPSATCSLGINGAYCKCAKPYQLFDEKDKVCKGEPCKGNSDCMYKGNCTSDGTCSCPEGTDGPICQDVIECIRKPDICGNGTDVKCVFIVEDEYPRCRCDDRSKWFNNYRKKCQQPCEYHSKDQIFKKDCGKYGRCVNQFCSCVPGVSGDFCEKIDQCESREVDCSGDPSATCSLGIGGAYCKCNKTYQVFDTKDNACKGEPCKKDPDCQFYGECTEDGTCFCSKGLGGPLCQTVYECQEKPDMCGNGTDVKCTFDVQKEKAVCQCDDRKEKAFDAVEKQCRKVCESDKECGMYGRCDRNSFCRCLEGVRGDNCEIIEKCINFDCGIRTPCILGGDGEAHCKCQDPHLGFDYEEKTCKNCDCGDGSKGCEFRNGQKICECAIDSYRKEGKCEACNCGELSKGCEFVDGKKECFCPFNYTTIEGTCQKCNCGIGSFNCKMEGEKTKCVCYEPYKQKKDKCEFCDCGVHGGECSFTDSGEKQCICKEGFKMLKESGNCTAMCNDTKKCQNGGLCSKGLCQCREDYAGAWCETPKFCLNGRCGHHYLNQDQVDCVWDSRKKEGRCVCKDSDTIFLETSRSCGKCACGYDGYCMLTAKEERLCICNKGYADYLLNCKRCDCGIGSTNCSFDHYGKMLCQCQEGYKQKTFSVYTTEYTLCAPCDCGKHGTCRYDGEEKVCSCEQNYKVYNGQCKECICGPYGFCSFDSRGDKVCTCDFGYSVREGKCESCDCEPPDLRGIGSVCLFGDNGKECHCPEGYEGDQNTFCKDIDECSNSTACPSNTNCLNMPGSYICQCKKGFKTSDPSLDPKKFGCEDINECAENPCTGSNTVCVNTPGSYDCKCKEGHYPTSTTSGPYYNPNYATCNKGESQWRSASIALGVILSLGIVGVVGFIVYQRKRKWN